MPIDARIPLGVQSPQLADPVERILTLRNLAQQQQAAEQERQIRGQQIQQNQGQLQTQQRQQADVDALDSAFAHGESRDAILQGVPGHLRATVMKTFTDADEQADRARKLKADTAAADADYFGALAAGVKPFLDDPQQAMGAVKVALSHAKSQGYEQADAIWQQLQQNPQALPQVVEGLLQQSPKFATLATQQQTAKATQESTAAQREETARHNRESERINTLTAGRAAAAQAETARHNQATEAANNPLAAMTGAAGPAAAAGALPTGDAFLQQLNPKIASEVKAYAEGRRPFPAGFALKSPYFQSLIQMVGQYDPTFDAANYNARNKARTDLTSPSGTGGKTINALNTALQHAGKLSDLIEQLGNTEYPYANAVINTVKSAAGRTSVTNFNAVAPQLAKEIERAWRGSGGSTSDVKDLIDSIGKNMGRQQQREALAQFVELAKGKLDATETQRNNVLGPIASQAVPILFDENKPIIEKITKRAGGESAGGGVIYARDPKGQLHQAPAGTPLPAGWKEEAH